VTVPPPAIAARKAASVQFVTVCICALPLAAAKHSNSTPARKANIFLNCNHRPFLISVFGFMENSFRERKCMALAVLVGTCGNSSAGLGLMRPLS
jgi:hypothetical protein